MPYRPEVTRPCPVADRLGEVMDGSFCRSCGKHVIDLDAMSDAEGRRRVAEQRGEACVRYVRPVAAMLSAAALASALSASPLHAQKHRVPRSAAEKAVKTPIVNEIIVGGIIPIDQPPKANSAKNDDVSSAPSSPVQEERSEPSPSPKP